MDTRTEIDRRIGRMEAFAHQRMYRACEEQARDLLVTVEHQLHGNLRPILMLVRQGLRAIHRHDVATLLSAAADAREAVVLNALCEGR